MALADDLTDTAAVAIFRVHTDHSADVWDAITPASRRPYYAMARAAAAAVLDTLAGNADSRSGSFRPADLRALAADVRQEVK